MSEWSPVIPEQHRAIQEQCTVIHDCRVIAEPDCIGPPPVTANKIFTEQFTAGVSALNQTYWVIPWGWRHCVATAVLG